MPYGNRRGPDGEGPMTGRRLGFCAGNDRPGAYADAPRMGRGGGRGGRGRGFGRGFSRGRGYGRMDYYDDYPVEYPRAVPNPNATQNDEPGLLKRTIEYLEEELTRTKERLQKLESNETSTDKK